jgi:hypothetical protein
MRRPTLILPLIHGAAATIALLTIALFWIATIASELSGDLAQVARVKQGIAWGLLVLVSAMAAAGGSGRILAGPSPRGLAGKKYRRMRIIAAVGLLVLVPAALLLAHWAAAGQFGTAFYAVQGVELIAGGVNLVLLGRSVRDGLRLRTARRRAEQRETPRPSLAHQEPAPPSPYTSQHASQHA